MASRRLNSDWFSATHYLTRVYTPGLEWIDSNDMTTVLMRHYPSLRTAKHSVENAFHEATA